MCLIVVGALPPLCFLFSVFQNARPPATPRQLGPPLCTHPQTDQKRSAQHTIPRVARGRDEARGPCSLFCACIKEDRRRAIPPLSPFLTVDMFTLDTHSIYHARASNQGRVGFVAAAGGGGAFGRGLATPPRRGASLPAASRLSAPPPP